MATLNEAAVEALFSLSAEELKSWWQELEPELQAITADDRNIGDFVVYKNFPQEVLEKSEAEYWGAQIFMY